MTDNSGGSRDEDAVTDVIERMAMTFADWGFPRMAARVLFAVMSAEEPLSAAELSERLNASPAAISGAVRYLTQLSLLSRDPVPGSRRDRYRMADHSWYQATVTRLASLERIIELADAGATAAGPGTPGGARLADMRDYLTFVTQEMVELNERWRRRQAEAGGSATAAGRTT